MSCCATGQTNGGNYGCHAVAWPFHRRRCPGCGHMRHDVYEREDAYAREIAGESGATHVCCGECDYQRSMDI